jgi:hypothetical protein
LRSRNDLLACKPNRPHDRLAIRALSESAGEVRFDGWDSLWEGGAMKAYLLEDGMLHVVAESALEAYALRKWGIDNFPVGANEYRNIIIDHSFVSQGVLVSKNWEVA